MSFVISKWLKNNNLVNLLIFQSNKAYLQSVLLYFVMSEAEINIYLIAFQS